MARGRTLTEGEQDRRLGFYGIRTFHLSLQYPLMHSFRHHGLAFAPGKKGKRPGRSSTCKGENDQIIF